MSILPFHSILNFTSHNVLKIFWLKSFACEKAVKSSVHLLLFQPSQNDVLGKNSLERSWEKLILIKRFWIPLQIFLLLLFDVFLFCFHLFFSLFTMTRWYDITTLWHAITIRQWWWGSARRRHARSSSKEIKIIFYWNCLIFILCTSMCNLCI